MFPHHLNTGFALLFFLLVPVLVGSLLAQLFRRHDRRQFGTPQYSKTARTTRTHLGGLGFANVGMNGSAGSLNMRAQLAAHRAGYDDAFWRLAGLPVQQHPTRPVDLSDSPYATAADREGGLHDVPVNRSEFDYVNGRRPH